MRVIDAGELSIDQLIDGLLSRGGLSQLLAPNTVACFVLARQALMPEFFRELVAGVHTIDGTLREHVEFIVFHGDQSTMAIRSRGTEYRYKTSGVSFSRQCNRGGKKAVIRFDDARADQLRWDTRSPIADAAARISEGAVSVLKKHFELDEASLPCLIFVDGESVRDRPVIVPIASDDPISSLYTDVLVPLSDALQKFERRWTLDAQVNNCGHYVRAASLRLKASAGPVNEAQAKLDWAKRRIEDVEARSKEVVQKIAILTSERREVKQFLATYKGAKSFEDQLRLVPENHPQSPSIHESLQRAERLQQTLDEGNVGADREHVQDLLERQRNWTKSLIGKIRSANKYRLKEITAEFDRIGFPVEDLFAAEEEASVALTREKSKLEHCEKEFARCVSQHNAANMLAREEQNKLKVLGYPPSLVSEARNGVRELVAHLRQEGKIGAGTNRSDVAKSLTILLLTAAPTGENPLDLEGEMRAIDEQVRGTLYRDNVHLHSGPGARPDDLLRLISEHRPQVVHFSGHGCPDGIVLRSDTGDAIVAGAQALQRLFRDRGVKVVVLNSCYSETQAAAIAATGAVVVGTTDVVDDEAAKRFSAAFYRSLANGYSVGEAFEDGGTAVDLHNLPDVYKIAGNGDIMLIC